MYKNVFHDKRIRLSFFQSLRQGKRSSIETQAKACGYNSKCTDIVMLSTTHRELISASLIIAMLELHEILKQVQDDNYRTACKAWRT